MKPFPWNAQRIGPDQWVAASWEKFVVLDDLAIEAFAKRERAAVFAGTGAIAFFWAVLSSSFLPWDTRAVLTLPALLLVVTMVWGLQARAQPAQDSVLCDPSPIKDAPWWVALVVSGGATGFWYFEPRWAWGVVRAAAIFLPLLGMRWTKLTRVKNAYLANQNSAPPEAR